MPQNWSHTYYETIFQQDAALFLSLTRYSEYNNHEANFLLAVFQIHLATP